MKNALSHLVLKPAGTRTPGQGRSFNLGHPRAPFGVRDDLDAARGVFNGAFLGSLLWMLLIGLLLFSISCSSSVVAPPVEPSAEVFDCTAAGFICCFYSPTDTTE